MPHWANDQEQAERFSKTLNKILEDNGISRAKRVAWIRKLFPLSQPAARKWLIGEGMPDTKKLPILARELGVSVDALMGQSPYEKPSLSLRARKLGEAYDTLSAEQQDQIDEYVEFQKQKHGT